MSTVFPLLSLIEAICITLCKLNKSASSLILLDKKKSSCYPVVPNKYKGQRFPVLYDLFQQILMQQNVGYIFFFREVKKNWSNNQIFARSYCNNELPKHVEGKLPMYRYIHFLSQSLPSSYQGGRGTETPFSDFSRQHYTQKYYAKSF